MFVETLAERSGYIFIIEEDSGCCKQKLLFVMLPNNIV
jgi:hypothetical protein